MRPTLLTWLDDAPDRLRISRALRDDAAVLHARTVGEFRESITARCDVCCTLIDSRQPAIAASLVNYVSAHRPGVAIIGIADFGMEHVAAFARVARAGAHRLIFRSADQTRSTMCGHLEDAARACAVEQVLAQVEPLCPERIIPLIRCLTGVDSEGMSVEGAALILGVSRRTLLRNCKTSHALLPAELLLWCRLILVEHLLLHTSRTVESLAAETGFPSEPALRTALRRRVGVSATEIRNDGHSTPVLDRFRATMIAARATT